MGKCNKPTKQRCNLVATNLRRLRLTAKLSQAELGARAGLTRAAICKIERTTGGIRTTTLEHIAEVLGVSPAEFWRPLAENEVRFHVPARAPYWCASRRNAARAAEGN